MNVVSKAREIAERSASGKPDAGDENAYADAQSEIARLNELIKDGTLRQSEERQYSVAWEASGHTKGHPKPAEVTEVRYDAPLPQGKRFVDLPEARADATLGDFGGYARDMLLGP